jgi:sec-independent protein translocase protein TatB
MFEVGFTEIILIFGLALLVLGPARLPKLAADVGRWAGRARAMARQLRTQLEQETHFDPLADTKPASTATHSPAPTIHPDTTAAVAAATGAGTAVQDADPASAPQDAPATEPLPAHAQATCPEKTVPDEPKPG